MAEQRGGVDHLNPLVGGPVVRAQAFEAHVYHRCHLLVWDGGVARRSVCL